MMNKATSVFDSILTAALAVSAILAGLFHEYIACFFGAGLLFLFLILSKRIQQFVLRINAVTVCIFAIVASYGISAFWALDSGMALIGFLKFLPVVLFLLLLLQDAEGKQRLIARLPAIFAIITVLSVLASLIPGLDRFLLVADRLAGPLQYPNTFALLLLIAELILVSQKRFTILNCGIFLVLIFGILYTGSRTVFVLAILANLALGFFSASKKVRWITLAGITGAVLLVLVVAGVSGSDILGRFLRFSLSESTFAGRLLYFQDALPVILKHPFGLGYRGYYYIQQSIQTGLYSTAYVHNEFLQLMLDIGWIPAVFLLVVMVKAIFDKKKALVHRVILGVMFLHFCFDFDLQFLSVYFILLLFLDVESGKNVAVRPSKPLAVMLSALTLIFLYMGTALLLPQLDQPEAARKMYPWNTQNNTTLLTKTESLEEGNALAEEILKQNEYVTLAYSMRSRYAYSQGSFSTLMACKQETFSRFPFQYAEYEEYCQMLITGIRLYQQAGDLASADVCKQELIKTKAAVEALEDRLSYLGSIIVDQPTTSLPEDLTRYIDQLAQ